MYHVLRCVATTATAATTAKAAKAAKAARAAVAPHVAQTTVLVFEPKIQLGLGAGKEQRVYCSPKSICS